MKMKISTYDMLVVATEDAVLVAPKTRATDVKGIVEDLKRDGRFPVDSGKARGVAEGSSYLRDIADLDHRIAVHQNRQIRNISDTLEETGNLDRKPTFAGVLHPSRDQHI